MIYRRTIGDHVDLGLDVHIVMRFNFAYGGGLCVMCDRGVEAKLFCLRG